MGAVNLSKNISRIHKQNLIPLLSLGLFLIKEPKRCRKRHSPEHIRRKSHHLLNNTRLNHLPPNLILTLTRIGRRICHHKPCLPCLIQRSCKIRNPKIIRIRHSLLLIRSLPRTLRLILRNTVHIKTAVILYPLIHNLINIERRICHHIIKTPECIIRVSIKRISLRNLPSHII